MKKKLLILIVCMIFIGHTKAQSYSANIDYTSKFIGKTVDLSLEYQKNKHSFSGGIIIYTNQKKRETYGFTNRFPLSPVHFSILKNAAFAETFIERFGAQIHYTYFFNDEKIVNPFISLGLLVSNIGFHSFNYIPNSYFDISKMVIWDILPGAGLKIQLYNNIFLNQTISPGLLYINKSRVSSVSSGLSFNPMYKIGLSYNFK